MGQLLRAHAADFQQAIAAEGHSTPHFRRYPPDRFAFDPRANARFIAIDNVWRATAARIPEVAAVMREVEQGR
jgi:hypothetical protein